MEKRCREVFAALSEFLDGTLPPTTCRSLEDHLRECKPCLAYLETLKSTIHACREYKVQDIPPPSEKVREALMRALADGRTPRSHLLKKRPAHPKR